MNAIKVSFEQLRQAVMAKGYPFFTTGDYNLNLVGIRNTQDLHADTFNDLMCVAFFTDGEPHLFAFSATTDPGVYYRENPMSVTGTLILPPGHYPAMWRVGKHQGQYQALAQNRPVTVWRDNDGNAELNGGRATETGYFGINCHRAAEYGVSQVVGRWSAGCQVVADSIEFDLLIALVKRAAAQWGDSFSYTLLEDSDL